VSTWERDQEIVKRSGRDEPVWVVIHMCMEATQRLYLSLSQTSKIAMVSLLSFMFFSSTKLEIKKVKQVLPSGRGGGGSKYK
jgi:hypothetical protein